MPSSTQEGSPKRDDRLGPYRIITTIGVGGMAEVLKAEDTRTGQHVALKLHYTPTDDEQVYLGYRREQRALARCAHPNVVRVLDYGVHERRPYLVMEFVDGIPLTEFLDERDLKPGPERDRMAALLGMQIASALDHVHSQNLVHRDIKPANILVTQDEIVKLIDFGIARDLGQEDRDGPEVESDVVGTYAFCSPEQVSGIPVDHRSDLYSFGVVLYLLVTGRLPFVAEQAVAYILKHVNEPPEPPENIHPGIPAELRSIVLELLEKNPADRPQSGRDVQKVLKAFVDRLSREIPVPTREMQEASRTGLRLYEPAYVGRLAEQAVLKGRVAQLEAGRGGVVLLEGDTGMGKTRLMDIAMADARARGLKVFSVRFLPEAGVAFQGLQELVEQLVSALSYEQRDRLRHQMGGDLSLLAQAFPAVAHMFPAFTPAASGTTNALDQAALQTALANLVEIVLSSPTVIGLKELHWADDTTLALISSLFDEDNSGSRQPVLWLAGISTDALSAEHPLRSLLITDQLHIQSIKIQPLDIESVEQLIRSMLGGRFDPGLIAVELYRETGGNPFSVAEAVRGLVDQGMLRPMDGEVNENSGWVLSAPLSQKRAPTIHQILLHRLESLAPESVSMLERIAVLGRPCTYEWLRRSIPVTEDVLLDTLEDLLARRILIERKGRKNSIFAFHHPRMAEIVLERIPLERRKTLHLQAAEAWLQAHGDGDVVSIELLGTHLFLAEDFPRAVHFLLNAAESRLRLGLNEAALHLLDRALTCTERAPEISGRVVALIHLRLGFVLQPLGRIERAWTHLRNAYRLARQEGVLDIQGEAIELLALLTTRQGDFNAARKHFADAMKLQQASGDESGYIRSMSGLAGSLWYLGRVDEAKGLYGDVLAHGKKVDDPGVTARALHGHGLVHMHEGHYSQAASAFMEASVAARRSERDAFHLLCQLSESSVRRVQGELGTARALAGTVAEKLERLGERDLLTMAYNALAWVALDMNDDESAQRVLIQCGSVLEDAPHHYSRAIRQMLVGRLELIRGRPIEAQLGLTEALTLATAQGFLEVSARVRRALAQALIKSGNPVEGMTLLKKAIADSSRLNNPPGSSEGYLFLADALIGQQKLDQAASVLHRLLPNLRRMNARLDLISALGLEARLRHDFGMPTESSSPTDEALRHIRTIRAGLNTEERLHFDRRADVRMVAAYAKKARRDHPSF